MKNNAITVEVSIQAPIETVWTCWTAPRHILQWNQPSAEWKTSRVENDLRPGGRFLYVMEAKDGTEGFDFEGAYDEVEIHQLISYTLTDGRQTVNLFTQTASGTTITETFDPVEGLSAQLQQDFCAGVLENFRRYTESQVGEAGAEI
ncbi:polyketide cyclase [Paraflavitalea soli]|uniref:Polyketide cyclase n=1 Tax=Paraflavitalea soli TaxID=2315862 RepID=A0A3B7MUH6_9BACT|nr:SRPBCC domain-containing protein [Paraflavitalea soli]AXY77748.1 polyketide cyclase [Paraflavitalea soli]